MTRPSAIVVDYYQILNLPFTSNPSDISKQQMKIAYHKALLRHHPDKARTITPNISESRNELAHLHRQTHEYESSVRPGTDTPKNQRQHPQEIYTIDEITTAYKTLSTPSLRAEYDRTLRLDRAQIAREKTGDVFHTGLEVVDLEDLTCDESMPEGVVWFRGCRCGDERGFCVTELELEREVEAGEILVGCRGCSLWCKVLFAVEAEAAEDEG